MYTFKNKCIICQWPHFRCSQYTTWSREYEIVSTVQLQLATQSFLQYPIIFVGLLTEPKTLHNTHRYTQSWSISVFFYSDHPSERLLEEKSCFMLDSRLSSATAAMISSSMSLFSRPSSGCLATYNCNKAQLHVLFSFW